MTSLKYSNFLKPYYIADDSNIFASHNCIRTLYKHLNEELATMLHLFHCNMLSINTSKTRYIVITKKQTVPVLKLILNGSVLQRETFLTLSCMYVDDKLT